MSSVDTCEHGRLPDSCERCAWHAAADRGAPLGGPEPGTVTQPSQGVRTVPAAEVDHPGVPVEPDPPAAAARVGRRPARTPFRAPADDEDQGYSDLSTPGGEDYPAA